MSQSKKILVSTPTFGTYSEDARPRLHEYGCEFDDLLRTDDPDRETIYEHLADAAAWVVGYTRVDTEALDRAPDLEVVAKHGTGVDNIDLDACRERDVVVANAPGANASAVAELVVLHILNLNRDLVGLDRAVRNGEWETEIGRELAGKTLGIVGLGDIGQSVVERTQGFDLEYVAFDVEERPAFQERYGVTLFNDLHAMLPEADFVTVHVPLNERTHHLIGDAELDAMRPTAGLVNTARGGIVDEAALLDALDDGQIAGAALDVLEEEPPERSDHYDRLFGEERVTLSPHIGGITEEALGRISDVTAENILAVFEGEEPRHRVA